MGKENAGLETVAKSILPHRPDRYKLLCVHLSCTVWAIPETFRADGLTNRSGVIGANPRAVSRSHVGCRVSVTGGL